MLSLLIEIIVARSVHALINLVWRKIRGVEVTELVSTDSYVTFEGDYADDFQELADTLDYTHEQLLSNAVQFAGLYAETLKPNSNKKLIWSETLPDGTVRRRVLT